MMHSPSQSVLMIFVSIGAFAFCYVLTMFCNCTVQRHKPSFYSWARDDVLDFRASLLHKARISMSHYGFKMDCDDNDAIAHNIQLFNKLTNDSQYLHECDANDVSIRSFIPAVVTD